MAKYPDRYPRDNFTTHIVVNHTPTGYRFHQTAGRIEVWKREWDGTSFDFTRVTDFTTYDLQIEGTVLTEAALIRAAIVWLKNNA